MSRCLFCRIAAGELPTPRLFEDADCLAFRDLHPQAPSHLLVIPRRHLASVNDLEAGDEPLVGHLVTVARQLAAREGCAERGYRLVLNCGAEAGQTVFHLHLHLLCGRPMGWPPG